MIVENVELTMHGLRMPLAIYDRIADGSVVLLAGTGACDGGGGR